MHLCRVPGQAQGLQEAQRYALRAALTHGVRRMSDSSMQEAYAAEQCGFLATSDAPLTPGPHPSCRLCAVHCSLITSCAGTRTHATSPIVVIPLHPEGET